MGLQHRKLLITMTLRPYKQKREAHSSLAPQFKAPENCPCSRNEQLRTSRRYDNNTL